MSLLSSIDNGMLFLVVLILSMLYGCMTIKKVNWPKLP
jgi:hypothetical protein